MQFEPLGAVSLDLRPQLQWLWHSAAESGFVSGDACQAFALPHEAPVIFLFTQQDD